MKTSTANRLRPETPWFLAVAGAGVIAGALLVAGVTRVGYFFTESAWGRSSAVNPVVLDAVLHYATSNVVPQQSLEEIRVSFNVLLSAAPCNFLVFGLGYDSLMWAAFNAGGTTLFLEEDPVWVRSVLQTAPSLLARTVNYSTRLSDADELLVGYKTEPACLPPRLGLAGNERCRLALSTLHPVVYDRDWDLIMIDAPRGYFPGAPGRMTAIYSAAVMARTRRSVGVTHVFLHDVDRKVERVYAEEFLCEKNRVRSVGRLWHFVIPPVAEWKEGDKFC